MPSGPIEINGAPGYVEVSGEGPPLLLIGGAVPTLWADRVVPYLTDAGLQTINFDYRVPPGWDGTPEGRTSLSLGGDALAVMDAIGAHSVHVVGYSRGGVAAYWLAATHPERVDRLVLLAPVAPFHDLFVDVEPDETPPDPAAALAFFVPLLFSAEYAAAHPDVVMDLLMKVQATPASVTRVARQEEESMAEAPLVVAPTLVVTFGADRMVGRSHADRLIAALPTADHVDLEGASHMAPIEQPHEVAGRIVSFLDA